MTMTAPLVLSGPGQLPDDAAAAEPRRRRLSSAPWKLAALPRSLSEDRWQRFHRHPGCCHRLHLRYNEVQGTKLPDWLAFFSGKRSVAIVTAVVSIPLASVVLLFAWPIIFGALVALGQGIAGMGGIGAGLYAFFFNRLLIPTGLHHA